MRKSELRVGLLNVRSWKCGKLGDICEAMINTNMDVLAVTQTTLRGEVMESHQGFKFLGKGRRDKVRMGGGVGVIVNEDKGLSVEQWDFECEGNEGEDIGVFKVQNPQGKPNEELFLIVCYMTVEGLDVNENTRKYEILSDLVSEMRNSHVAIVGDMNGHTGILDESINKNGRMLMDFAEDCEYEILNHTIGQGKVTWKSRAFESAIDYMMVNQKARERVKEMVVDEEGEFNVDTDHNAIVLSYRWGSLDDQGSNRVKGRAKAPPRTDSFWKCRGRDYEGFEADLSELDCLYGNNPAELNDCLIKRINQTAAKHFKKGKFGNKGDKKGNKKWWNMEVEEAVKERRRANKKKRQMERRASKGEISESILNDYWEEYRRAKDRASQKIGEAIRLYEKNLLDKAREKGNGETNEWYSFIKGDQGCFEYPKSIVINGKVFEEYSKIKEGIEEYMMGISGADRGRMKYSFEGEALEISGVVEIDMEKPSIEEIRSTLKVLKDNKGVGMDGIPYEMYKKGGVWIEEALLRLFGDIWENECKPGKWNESKVMLIFKGGNKSKKDLKNYRPISLANTVGKIFSRIIYNRLKVGIEMSGILGEEQNGFRMNRRGEDNIYMIRELMEIYKKKGKKIFFAFLDIEKAYDKLNRRTLLIVLEKLGIPIKIRNLIKGMYENTKAKFIFGDVITDWVQLKKGVRQGCVLSPMLFSMYTEELIRRVKKENYGVTVGENKIGTLLYADDIVLIAEEEDTLQRMLDIAVDYSREFSLVFSTSKCGVMVFNGENEDGMNFRMGNDVLNKVNKYNYLGVMFDDKGADCAKQSRIFKANQWWGRLFSIAKFRANKYEVIRGIWKNIALPSLLYGMDTIPWTINEINQLEIIQNKIGRMALGGNKCVGIEAIRGEMGWSSFEERLMKGKLKWKIRIERMDDNRWVKRISREAGVNCRWMRNCVGIMNKGGLFRVWNPNGEDRNEWKLAYNQGDRTEYDEKDWKVFINNRIKEYGLEKWRRGIENKGSLHRYRKKKCPSKEDFYVGDWASSLLFKARAGSLELKERTYRYNQWGNKECVFGCNVDGRIADESVQHLMTECGGYPEIMEWAIGEYRRVLGVSRFREITLRGDEDQGTDFFLGLGDDIPWEVIEVTKKYLVLLMTARQEKINMTLNENNMIE